MLKVSDQGSTTSALKQQLQQSGLLTALPGMLSTAAQEVSTYAEDPAQLAALFDNAALGSGSASGNVMNTVHGTTPYLCQRILQTPAALPRTLQKLFGEDNLLHTPLASSVQLAVQLAAASVGFMCSSMQQQQEDAAGKLGGSLSHLLEEVHWTMHIVALMTTNAISAGAPESTAPTASGSNARRSTRQHRVPQQRHQQQQQQQEQELVQQLLVSPSWLRVSGFLLVAHCYALLRSQQQPAPPPAGGVNDNAANTISSSGAGSSSSSSGAGCSSNGTGNSSGPLLLVTSSSNGNVVDTDAFNNDSSTGERPLLLGGSSGSSSSTGVIDTEASTYMMAVYGMYEKDSQASNHAANFAADWQDELPASHMQLLQMLKCSSKCVLWAAGLLASWKQIGLLCGLAAARTITAQWVRACIPRQGQDSVADSAWDAASTVVDAAPDVMLATVMLHCAAHLNPGSGLSDPQTEAYVKLCKTAAMLASAAWAVPFNIFPQLVKAAETQAAPLGPASEQLQTALSAAQQLAAAEGEQVFFLQHVTSQLLKLLRKHAEVLPHMQPAAAPLLDGGRSSGSGSSPPPVAGDAASTSGGSQGDVGSSSSTYAVSAVAEALLALQGARGHFLSRVSLRIMHTANEGTVYDNCQVLSSATSDCARVGVHTPLAACFQDCVRLGAVVEQLQPQREVIRTWCELFGALSPFPFSLLLGGLTAPPGSPQQQQLFGLMCSLLKTVQPKVKAVAGVQSNQHDVPTCHKVVMTVLEVAAAAVNLQLPQAAVPWGAAVDSSTQGQPAAASATAGSVATSAAAAAAAPQATNKLSSDSAGTLSMVPWLVLMGRCYLTLALPLYSDSVRQHAVHECHMTWLSRLQLWLQGSSTSADLAAAGLNPTGLWQAVQDTLAALQTLQDNNGAGADVGPSTGLQQQEQEEQQQQDQAVAAAGEDLARRRLHALGVCLSSLPLSWGCSSPVCTNLQGPTEAGIVQGKGHVCKGCHTARYCDKACQALHWKQHKLVCNAIAAAAAAAVAVNP
jgi:hypothetical protein